jgi:hypothetical protein
VSRQQQSRPERKARTAQERTVNASWCAPFALRGPEVAKRAYESTPTITVRLESVSGWSFGKLKGLFRRGHLMPNGLLYWSRRSASSTRFGTKIVIAGYPNGYPISQFWTSKWIAKFFVLDVQTTIQLDIQTAIQNSDCLKIWLSKWTSKNRARLSKANLRSTQRKESG